MHKQLCNRTTKCRPEHKHRMCTGWVTHWSTLAITGFKRGILFCQGAGINVLSSPIYGPPKHGLFPLSFLQTSTWASPVREMPRVPPSISNILKDMHFCRAMGESEHPLLTLQLLQLWTQPTVLVDSGPCRLRGPSQPASLYNQKQPMVAQLGFNREPFCTCQHQQTNLA